MTAEIKFRFFRLRLLLEKMGFPGWGDYYRCIKCGHFFPKDTAKISGYDSESSLRHIHCPRCNAYLDL